jgi:hypothetical protein
MNTWGVTTDPADFSPNYERPLRRVREEVKDGVAVVLASAAFSTTVAIAATVVSKLAS